MDPELQQRRRRLIQALEQLRSNRTPEAVALRKRMQREVAAIDASRREPRRCLTATLRWLNGLGDADQLLAEIQQDPLNTFDRRPPLRDRRVAAAIVRLRDQQPRRQLRDLESLRPMSREIEVLLADLLYTGALLADAAGDPITPVKPEPQPNVGVLLPVRLETRFYPPAGDAGWLLRVLVVPDEPLIDRHDPLPHAAELDSVERLWQSAPAGLDSEAGRIAWRAFADRHGGARAAWLARTFPPLPPDADGVIRINRPAETRTTARFNQVGGFPEEIELWLGRSGNPPTRIAVSPVKTDQLLLDLPNPKDPNDQRWWSSWEQAKIVGLGIEVDLGPATPDDLDVLFVIGLGAGEPSMLFSAHRDSGTLGLIEPGTPTNTVDGAPAADLAHDDETWRQIAIAPEQAGANSQFVSQALAGKPDVLGMIPGDDFDHRAPGEALMMALWPVLWGHALKDIWGLGEGVQQAGLWAGRYVLPEGPLPPIRINDQPYGLLPVTSLRGWKPDGKDPQFDQIEAALLPSLLDARSLWAAAAESAGNVTNADAERLLQLLGHTSTANAYAYRWFVSLELLQMLYYAYDGGMGWAQAIKWWQTTTKELSRFPLNPQRMYASLGWPQDLRIPLVAPADIPPDTIFAHYLDTFFPAHMLVEGSLGLWFERERGNPSRSLPDSLLARLLLHARFVTAAEVHRAAQKIPGPALEPVADNTKFWTQLAEWALAMQPSDLQAGGVAVEMYERVLEAIHMLLKWPVGELDRIMRATLDTAAYRIDPWVTAYAWRRLQAQTAASHSYQIGVYGWVDAPRPGSPGPTDGGLLHAPSEQQALAAVILRDKALSDPQPDRWQMNLQSSSIRLAEQIAEEVRLGAHIQEVLGRHVERIAASKATVEDLRSLFPTRTEHAGRRVCNGEAILKADPATLPLTDEQRTALEPLRQALDSYGDLLVAEAVYHVVAGRGAVAGAAMEAAAGLAGPPNLEVISTRRLGRSVNTNVVIALPTAAAPPIAFDTSPGTIADPAVAALLSTLVGAADSASWQWQVLQPDGTLLDVTLDAIGLVPIDAVMLGEEELARLVLTVASDESVLNSRWPVRHPDGTTEIISLADLDLPPNEIGVRQRFVI